MKKQQPKGPKKSPEETLKKSKASGSATKNSSKKLSLYSNLSTKHKTKKDAKKAARPSHVPDNFFKRMVYYLHPKRFWAYWFSKEGGIMALKVLGVAILLGFLFVGSLFAYFRKDLDQIRPGEIDKQVQSTVNKYYDRNGKLLWEDKGDGNYRLTAKSDEISDFIKNATISIEDRDFLKHSGVSIPGTIRAALNNFSGKPVQGGSTLSQQLVKQVFFADEASDRSWGGIPRKIKELILAIEIERMYDKDQILTLYLNESPYGGRRNGVQSGAQTYFGKSAKEITLAEAALLAAIPQNPTVFDPYNVTGHEGLINRQHHVLNAMLEEGYITKEQAEEAKAFPILDNIKPQASQFKDIKAPHFVQMVRSQVEEELGKAVVGRGGLTITTTLDLRIQEHMETAMKDMFGSYVPDWAGFTNGAATMEDNKTGQIVGMVGSRDFEYEGFGQDNASTAYIQPGSSVKSLVYAELFEQKPEGSANFGSGDILVDEPIDEIYGTKLQNADRRFNGSITIRSGLATSRNIPAVKAMYISGVEQTVETIRNLGATSYCSVGADRQAGLASAIGGCGVKQTDLVNAYASIARGGVNKEQSSILEVKDNGGEVLIKWNDSEGTRAIESQSAYIVTDILADVNASAALGNYSAKNISGVKTATKTGTSDKGGYAKDLWMLSYTPALTLGVWFGNPDTTILKNGTSSIGSPYVAYVMEKVHKEIYGPEGKWSSTDWFEQPQGIKRIGREVYPSWWDKTQGQTAETLKFNKFSKKKAVDCTPPGAIIEVPAIKTIDPVTKKEAYANVPSEYNWRELDDCGSISKPTVVSAKADEDDGVWKISVSARKGSYNILRGKVSDGGALQCSNTTCTGTSQSSPVGKTVTVEDEAGQVSAGVSIVN